MNKMEFFRHKVVILFIYNRILCEGNVAISALFVDIELESS